MRISIALSLLAVLLAGPHAPAGEPPSGEKPRPVATLPEPLPAVACNITELEQSGYFTVIKVAYGRTVVHNDEAMIWTLRVDKPITCRHALFRLRRFRDVRFYHTAEGARHELHWTLLDYPERLSSGAVDGDLLKAGERFDVWIVLGELDVRRLKNLGADTVVLSELRHEPSGSQ